METIRQAQTHFFFDIQVHTNLTDLHKQNLENPLSKRHSDSSCEKIDLFFFLSNSSELFQISFDWKKKLKKLKQHTTVISL